MQEVSGAYTSLCLDTDELKMALRARKVSRNGPLNRETTNLMYHTKFSEGTSVKICIFFEFIAEKVN